ncbi:maleylpyruvate isomerase N-terminal domain-containing protein [Nonomuraea sp. NPDC049607]|uniref:maleylpyruvate isomerase N-terminal domain-containing protein n=1 Tax=Nonomuraea sp. NPDC049607 TaxID=3154732 RepID=UPI0034348BEA
MDELITYGKWASVRGSLKTTADRFAKLISIVDPQAMATREWTVAETAAHVTAIASLYTSVVRGDVASPFPELAEAILQANVDTVSALNELAFGHFAERDPLVLAERLRADVREILSAGAEVDPATPVPWLGDARVPVAGVLAHLLNELLLHGWDVARATRTPWSVPARDAGLFFDLFLIGMIRNDYGRLMDTGSPAPPRRITVGFHSAHTAPAALVLDRGRVSVAEAGARVDAHVGFDPAALNLLLFGRMSRTRAALTGKAAVWGRRPWLLPAFLRFVRLPTTTAPRARVESIQV